jgi:hypothetical protein
LNSHLGNHGVQLGQVVHTMHRVEAAPLIYAERPQPGMGGHPFHAEFLATTIKHRVHGVHFPPQQVVELPAIHGRKTPRSWHRLVQRRNTPGEASEAENHQLQ